MTCWQVTERGVLESTLAWQGPFTWSAATQSPGRGNIHIKSIRFNKYQDSLILLIYSKFLPLYFSRYSLKTVYNVCIDVYVFRFISGFRCKFLRWCCLFELCLDFRRYYDIESYSGMESSKRRASSMMNYSDSCWEYKQMSSCITSENAILNPEWSVLSLPTDDYFI